jgi:TusA-related sulfurtransferase
MIQVDARGLSCPEPLIRSRQGITQLNPGDTLEILVDTVTSRENVRRFLMSKGYTVEIEEIEGGYKMIVRSK